MDSQYIPDTVRAWNIAASRLGIIIHTPYILECDHYSIECLAYLPHFGSPNGMVIGWINPPRYERDRRLIECARNHLLYCSFIVPHVYSRYEDQKFREALMDWGYYGPKDQRPPWCE